MRQKKWKERIGGNPGLIIIGAFIILSIILAADHLFNLPRLLSGAPPEQFEWGELVFDIIAIFCIGLISFTLVRKSEAERREVEQIHWRERDKAQEYLNIAGVILVAINAEQKVTLINRKGCKILGYKEEEITGENWFDHFLPEWDRERVRATFIRLMPGGQKAAEYFENPVLIKSGEERIIAWHNTLLTDETGNITGTLSSGEDITEHKQQEEKLKKSDQLLRDTGEMAKVGGWELDLSTKEVLWTEEVGRIHGVEPGYKPKLEEAMNFYAPESRPALESVLKKAMETGEPYDLEFLFIPSGSTDKIWVRSLGRAVYSGGKIVKLTGTFQNIDKYKRAEESLRESEEKYRTLFETMVQGVVYQDRTGKITSANSASEAILGLTFDQMLGRTSSDPRWKAIHEDGSNFPDETHPSMVALKTGKTVRNEVMGVFHPQESKYHWIIINAIPQFRPGEDTPYQVYTTFIDITEPKRAEKALRESEERYRLLADNVSDVIWTMDLNFKFTYFSPSIKEALGYTPEEIICKRPDEVITPASYELIKKVIAEEMEIEMKGEGDLLRSRTVEVEEVRKDGTTFWVEIKTSFLRDADNKAIGILGITRDITEHKKAEEEREKILLWQQGVNKLQQLLLMPSPLGDKLKVATDGIVRFFDADFCRIWLIRPGDMCEQGCVHAEVKEGPHVCRYRDRCLHLLTSSGRYTHTDGKGHRRVPFGCYKIGRVASGDDHKFLTNDVQNDSRVHNLQWVRELGLVSFAGHQLRVTGGKILGVLALFAKHAILPAEDAMTDGLSSSIALVIQQAVAEERLEESKTRYKTLVENLPQKVFLKNRDLVYLSCNENYARGLKIKPNMITGKTDYDFYPKGLAEKYRADDKRIMQIGKTEDLEEEYLQEGQAVFVHTVKTPVKDEKGNIIGVLGIFWDISERKKAEEVLRTSEEKYRAIVENATDQIFTLDRQCRFLAVNKTAAEISRKSVSEMVGKSLLQIFPKETAAQFSKNIEEVFETSQNKFIEERMCLGGKEFYSSTTLNPIKDDKGYVVAVTGIVRDITEMKRLQEQLIQSEKLAAVGTLAYGIAHEFNNILAGMMANAELGLITKDSNQIKECLEIIVESSQRASSITNNLLAFARQKEARKELIDLTEPLKSVLSITRRELEKHNVELIEKFKSIPKIYCDPGQFSEVFLNMITNARDAMHPKGGTLTIQVESSGDCIRIIFKDTGCGIPEEIKGRIFEPFITTKGALGKSEIPGTGLGLFLTYGIIDGYKGKIEVETKVGKGTKFSIIIPISENQPRELLLDTRIESSKETDKKLKILLVDDEKAITLGLKKFLESKGHKVSTSLRAKEGLEIFRKGRFDLVLSDITIPDMDGIELIKKVKEKDQQAKIIVITGHLQKEKEEKAREAGADEVLIKPFKNELLYQAISKVVDWR